MLSNNISELLLQTKEFSAVENYVRITYITLIPASRTEPYLKKKHLSKLDKHEIISFGLVFQTLFVITSIL